MTKISAMANDQLIGLCKYLLEFLGEPGIFEAYHMREWQELEECTRELLKRAGLNMDLDECDLCDFDRIVDMAISAIKTKYTKYDH